MARRSYKMPWHAKPFFGGGRSPGWHVPSQEEALEETPEWVPDGAVGHFDFRAGQYYADGELEFADLWSDGATATAAASYVSSENGFDPPSLLVSYAELTQNEELAAIAPVSGFTCVIHFFKAGNGNLLIWGTDTGDQLDLSISGGTLYASMEGGGYDAGWSASSNTEHKVAITVKSDMAVAASLDGASVLTSSAGDVPDEVALYLAGCGGPSGAPMVGKFYSFTFYAPQLDADLPVLSAMDIIPSAFTFIDQIDVEPDTLINSAWVQLAGTTGSTAISVTGGQYQIADDGSGTNATSATAVTGTIAPGKWFRAVHTSSVDPETSVNTVLTIGGVSDTFTSTTAA